MRCLLAFLILPLTAVHAAEPYNSKPNIVLILADDFGYGSLGCYGNKDVKTPNIDSLASSGVRLTDFHSNGPLCTPTRAAILTGRYQQRCDWVPDEDLSTVFREQRKENPVQRWAWGISKNEVTLPAVLKQAGYRTGLIGKWHLGYDRQFHPMNYGFDEFRGFIGGHVDEYTHIASHGLKELDWWKDGELVKEPGFATDLLTQHAVDFIGRNKDAPFLLYLAHQAVHSPIQLRDPSKKRSAQGAYKEMITILDESVGSIIAALKSHQLESNTLLIFCSDNGPTPPAGFSATGGLKGVKNELHEGGHRVPFIASWPGNIPAGTANSETVMTMDLMPTLAKLAGAVTPSGHILDGLDILPILKGDRLTVTRDLHWQSAQSWAIRRGHWKLIGNKNGPSHLYDLAKDLNETNNLLTDQLDLAHELYAAHVQWVQSVILNER